MKEVQSKRRVSEMKTGTHLATIADLVYLRDAAKNLQLIDGFNVVVVTYQNDDKSCHEQHYILDGDKKEKYLYNMMKSAGVDSPETKEINRNDLLGRKLWISICEVHYVNDDVPIKDFEGNDRIEYYIFKYYPSGKHLKKPHIPGDPSTQNGIPSGEFITYRNVTDDFTMEEKPVMPVISKKIQPSPDFDDNLSKADEFINEEKKALGINNEMNIPVFSIEPGENAAATSLKAKNEDENLTPNFD